MSGLFKKISAYGIGRLPVYVFIKACQSFRIKVYRHLFSDNRAHTKGVKFNQPAQFVGLGSIVFDSQVTVGVWPSPYLMGGYAYFEARTATAEITVGEGTCFNNSAVVIADRGKVAIGRRCMMGNNFFVADSDFHGLEVENRTNGQYQCADVFIGDDVFFGNDVKVLKGVTIHNGAVIGSGAVVTGDVPAGCIYAGVPAKFVRHISRREGDIVDE
ncbi:MULTISPECIES: acyltransferase [Pseudomonas]|nr:acyltransferase [Pseudomonas reactans]